MKKIILFKILFFFVIIGNAQTWQWGRCGDILTGGEGFSVCNDPFGNAIITGVLTIQPAVFGPYTLTTAGLYLVKYDPAGNVLWAKNPTNGLAFGISVCSDNSGNIFVTGYAQGNPVFDTYTLNTAGFPAPFIAKYDPSGNVLWVKRGLGEGEGWGVSADQSGNSFITGRFSSPTIVFGTYTLTNTGTKNVFLAKYDPLGNLLWAKSALGTDSDIGQSVSNDASGNAFITGAFNSPTIAFGTYSLSNAGTTNLFLTKYDSNGNVLWARSAGAGVAYANSVSTDASGNAYITGNFSPSIVFGTYTLTGAGFPPASNAFFTKYSATGNVLWAKAPSEGAAWSVHTYPGGVFFEGAFGTGPITIDNFTISVPLTGNEPVFIINFDQNGNVIFTTSFPGGGDDVSAISVDNFCNLYLSGDFMDLSLIVGNDTIKNGQGENIFLAKLSFTTANCYLQPDAISEFISVENDLILFPNPNNGSFKVQMDTEIKNTELIIINSLGLFVHQQKMTQSTNEIITKGLSKGLYYYSVLQNNKQIKTGKISIE